MNRSVIYIALVLLWMVCITTQTTLQQAKCDRFVKKNSCRIPVDGVWEEWTETSACTVTCGGGKTTYSRNCIQPQHGGKACEGDDAKPGSCGEQKCPVDGVWEEWTETSSCTVTCGGGKKTYSRKCIKPQHGGNWCEGDASKIGSCGEQECPDTWQCDCPVTVVRDVKIPWNPDSETIAVTTNSVAGSEEKVDVTFFDKDGEYAGNVYIGFYTQIEYLIGWCTDYTPFPATLPAETEKTWTITYNYTEWRVVLHCNGVQVVNVVLSDSACATERSSWRGYWERKPTQIKFYSGDTASDSYCMSSNTGAI